MSDKRTAKIGFDTKEREAILRFIEMVDYYAEGTIHRTGIVEGAHWNAMRRCMSEVGITRELQEARTKAGNE